MVTIQPLKQTSKTRFMSKKSESCIRKYSWCVRFKGWRII